MKKIIKILPIVLITCAIATVNFHSINIGDKKDLSLEILNNRAQACEERVGGSSILLMIYCSGTYQVWNPTTQCYDTIEYSGCADANSTC